MPNIPDSHLDLTELPVATLATIGPDGRPQVSAVWFLYDDGKLRMSLNRARQKTKNMEANPSATLFLLDATGSRYVEVRGNATFEPDLDYEFADRLGVKYGNPPIRAFDQPGETRVAVTIEPTRINAVDMNAH